MNLTKIKLATDPHRRCGTVSGNFGKGEGCGWLLIGSGTLDVAVGKALGPTDKFVVKGQKRGMKFET